MTLAVAFVRSLRGRADRKELVFASDSRLTGGQCMDFGPKILSLPRSDALLSFAGDTSYAYPLALHLQTAISIFPRSVDRRLPLTNARGHMLRVYEQLYRSIHGLPFSEVLPIADYPPVQFLFGGYAWHADRFRIWCITLDRTERSFRFATCGYFQFIGNPVAAKAARRETLRRVYAHGRTPDSLDMEPFEVLRDVIRSRAYNDVGGAPQISKVYRHMNAQHFSVLWPHGDSTTPHVNGRPLLPTESSDLPVFDPDALRFAV